MASIIGQQLTPTKRESFEAYPVSPRRRIKPSPESQTSHSILVLSPSQASSSKCVNEDNTGSPVKRPRPVSTVGLALGKHLNGCDMHTAFTHAFLEKEFSTELGKDDPRLKASLQETATVNLGFSFVENGRAELPSSDVVSKLYSLFPETVGYLVHPPYLILYLKELPAEPRPFRIGGLITRFCKSTEDSDVFAGNSAKNIYRGKLGCGPKILQETDLLRKDEFSHDIARAAVKKLHELHISVYDITCFDGYWIVTVAEGTDPNSLPCKIASLLAYYCFKPEALFLDPSAQQVKMPSRLQYDDTLYASENDSLLRPGVMLSSSNIDGYLSTTSGVLVRDQDGGVFVTAAAHRFRDDKEVWHPDPIRGKLIGKVVKTFEYLDIALIQLNAIRKYPA